MPKLFETAEAKLLRPLRQHDQRGRTHRPLQPGILSGQRLEVPGSTLDHSPHRRAAPGALLCLREKKTPGSFIRAFWLLF